VPTRPPLVPDAVRASLAGIVGRVEVLPRCPSTSTALADAVRAEPREWGDRSVLVTDHQVAGRGRAGRTWTTPQGAALTFSVLLRPAVATERWGWLPLLGGLAVVRAVRDAGVPAAVKWPNDVLVPAPTVEPGWGAHRKVAGLLGDLLPDVPGGPALVLGIGINVDQQQAELPVASATSLALAGLAVDRTALLRSVLAHLVALDDAWRQADGDAPDLAAACAAACATLGQDVVASLPGGEERSGRAVGLGPDGALVLAGRGGPWTVHAGDVRLRTVDEEPPG
jgi:BirA family biotin operon repressor/biotin-[acetyl-CoA-carboxylase] ligase